jgi:hypothetical protein
MSLSARLLSRRTSDEFRSCPTLGRAEDDHGPAATGLSDVMNGVDVVFLTNIQIASFI